MTPAELLEIVKARNNMLLIEEEDVLNGLLRQALGVYQDRAGVIGRLRIQKSGGVSLPFPPDYLSLVHVTDANGSLVYSDPYEKTIELELTGREKWPFTLLYYVNLRDRAFDDWQVPAEIVGTIEDYLEVLIHIQNAPRLRFQVVAGKFDASNLLDEQSLTQRKLDLETQIAANRAIVPGSSTW